MKSQSSKAKFIILSIIALFVFFFSNDFGLIDVEKTSIITAIAIDKEDDEFLVTAQIAVPEATDTNSENLKAQIIGKGSTVGGAIKNLGDFSGWFPKLAFCNLILIGNDISQNQAINVLDYFAKTLRVQDSALVAIAENKAYELLNLATPLDNISAFALQKIMLKNTGFDRDVCATDVKTFCAGHYSLSSSAFMPIVKSIPSEKDSSKQTATSSSQSSSASQEKDDKNKKNLFDASTTALFYQGKRVGELDSKMTLAFNAITTTFKGTTFSVDNVEFKGQLTNYLLTVNSNPSSITVIANDNGITLNVNLTLYCKISDHSADGSNESLSQNTPLPFDVKIKAENFFKENIIKVFNESKRSNCDVFNIKEKLYRFNYKQYSKYKDNYFPFCSINVNVSVEGQR